MLSDFQAEPKLLGSYMPNPTLAQPFDYIPIYSLEKNDGLS